MPAHLSLSRFFPPTFFLLSHTNPHLHCRSVLFGVSRLIVNSVNLSSSTKHLNKMENLGVTDITNRIESISPKKPKLDMNVIATPMLFFVKLSDKAHPPTKGSKFAAGYDLKSAYDYIVPARDSCLVKTDIQIQLPRGTYGRVAPRSGLALKNKIDVGAGVIDEDYRGNVGVILFNLSDEDFKVAPGDRVAQLICEKIEYPEIEEKTSLDESERGDNGFGSTGVGS